MITEGPWRHYKGGVYLLVAVAQTHEHNGDRDVVYISLERGHYVTRPFGRDSRQADSWTDIVTWPDGEKRPRFVREKEYPTVWKLFEKKEALDVAEEE